MGGVQQALDGQPRGRLCGRQRLGSQPGRRHPEVGRGRGTPLQAQGHAGPPARRRLLRRCKNDQPPLQARPTISAARDHCAESPSLCIAPTSPQAGRSESEHSQMNVNQSASTCYSMFPPNAVNANPECPRISATVFYQRFKQCHSV